VNTDPRPADFGLRTPTWGRWVLALVALAMVLGTRTRPGSWADASRLATIESLVERGTLAIDGSSYFWQGDKVHFPPHYYSHQPPLLALLGALPYAALHAAGATIAELEPAVSADGLATLAQPWWNGPWAYRVLNWCLVGAPVWFGLWALQRLLLAAGSGPRSAALLTAAAYFATPLWPWSLVLNQHGPAAGLGLLALLALQRRRAATAGTLLALAATIDLSAVFPAAAGLWPVARGGGARAVLRYALGALPVLCLHGAVNLAVAGDLVPFGMHAEAFRYPMSPFLLMSLTGVTQELFGLERAVYVFGATFGASGLFSHHPLLLLCAGAGLALPFLRRRDGPPELAPGLLTAVALGSVGVLLYYLFQSNNYGGSAFGMRWFAVFAPSWLLFAGVAAVRSPALRRPLPRGLFFAATALSVAGSALGAVNPWAKFHYRWQDSPAGRVAERDTPRPTLREHWTAEWARIRQREPINAQWYDQTYARLLDQHRRLYLRETPWLDAAGREAWLRQGLTILHGVVDPLDSDRSRSYSRVMGHYWLGKFHAELGDRAAAEREYHTCLALHPDHGPATNALRNLRGG
jgi:hypothetical protein